MNNTILLDPKKRLTIPEILNHNWLKETRDDSSDDELEDLNTEDRKVKEEENKNSRPSTAEKKDFDSVSGNVNYVKVDNLFNDEYSNKLSYTDYCCITEDFTTHNLNEDALKKC